MLRSQKTLLVLALAGLILFLCAGIAVGSSGVGEELPSIPVVSYIRTWPIGSEPADMDRGERWSADDIKGNLLTTLNIAFGLLDGNKIYIQDLVDRPGETDENITIPAFDNLFDEIAILKQRYPHLKVNLSVGGWGAEGFHDMAKTKENREEFISDAINWIVQYNLDGIDIDWEYPVGPEWGQEIKSGPEDADNYVALLTELRTAFDALSKELGRPLTVTTAVPASAWFTQVIDVNAVQEQVDYLKLMSYDYYGGWSATTGHASNLYNNPNDPAWGGWSTDQAVTVYLNAGVKPEKILVGVPFYARAWRGVPPENNGLFQPYKEAAYPHGLTYMDIQSKILTDPSFKRYWDDVAKAPFLYNGDLWITYEDAESLAYKIEYIREKGLAGIMIWEYAHDINEVLLEALNQAINEGK
ncbi:MAG TPA: glycoside hydrolase family 18 protein [Firmicutes bacterium]|nr:glycoside hydrolase family 18 protein [Bacillota bacterium]